MKILSIVFWSQSEIDDNLIKYSKRIKVLRGIYALIIVFACLVTFVTLVISPQANSKDAFATFAKVSLIITFFVFIVDWISHAITYKFVIKQTKISYLKSLLKYIFTFNSIVIILCLLSSGQAIKFFINNFDANNELLFATFQSLGLVRVIRLFMVLSLFKPFGAITGVFVHQRKLLTSVFFIIIVLIILFAIIIWSQETVYLLRNHAIFLANISNKYSSHPEFNIFNKLSTFTEGSGQYEEAINKVTEEQVVAAIKYLDETDLANFNSLANGYIQSFPEAFYFTTITLTTVGYGDFSPHAPISRVIVSFISLLAIAIVAIPSGIIAGSFLSEMEKRSEQNQKEKKKNKDKYDKNIDDSSKVNLKKKTLDECELIPINFENNSSKNKKSLDECKFIEMKL
ncbi:potassium channel family protein [Mycoplasma sp. T363T]|uniref:Potassium channel family protein n=1 Tax=Mycoplasma bradburyae TaxID=2963128 RepID=A0AAW6HRX3_9MOLU|nr:potassium channel family protein [Mycoplasma bradburyae]MDC4163055.1 potassium channel family protein [Mycoplasma bradburyae]MDC4183100.1 potassium channel family protein [Mycoplasma bradburyae]UTS70665.1 potassium channel family protein [Mycoplasma bradburyae]